MKKKKEIELNYKYDDDHIEDFSIGKRETLEDEIYNINSDINDCKKGSNLFNKLTDKHTSLTNLTKLSDKDLKDKYEDEYDEHCSEMNNIIWNDIKDEIEDKIEGYYIVGGSMGLWNGNKTVNELRYFEGFNDFLNNMAGLDNIIFKYYNNGELDFKYSHHDGTNSYYLTPIKNLSKSQLITLIESSDKDVQYLSKYIFKKGYKTLNKEELITLAVELMD